jgi:hypothetical protein
MKLFCSILILFFSVNFSALGQNLYIQLDLNNGKQSKFVNAPYYSKVDKVQRIENAYVMYYYLYYGYSLSFISKNRAKATIIPLTELPKYDIKTCESLEVFLKSKTDDERMNYFHSFQKIFIVEINNRNQQATLTEVEIDVDIE